MELPYPNGAFDLLFLSALADGHGNGDCFEMDSEFTEISKPSEAA